MRENVSCDIKTELLTLPDARTNHLAAGKSTFLAELFESIVHETNQRADGTAGNPDGRRHISECTSGAILSLSAAQRAGGGTNLSKGEVLRRRGRRAH